MEDVHAHYMLSRVRVMKKIKGNPFGAAFKTLHGRYCSTLQNPASALMNRAGGFNELSQKELDEVIEWYKDQDVIPKITVIPDVHSANFLKLLKIKGFKVSKIWNTAELFALTSDLPDSFEPQKQIRISEPESKAELDTFARIYVDSFNFPSEIREGMRENIKRLSAEKNTKLYIGYLNDEPGSVGVLHIHEKSGYLAMTGTLKKFRGKGLHTALIHHRVIEARNAHVRLISGSATLGSISQKNMECTGLTFSHIQQTWALG